MCMEICIHILCVYIYIHIQIDPYGRLISMKVNLQAQPFRTRNPAILLGIAWSTTYLIHIE